MSQFYIQYHNAEKMGFLPNTRRKNVEGITFDTSVKKNFRFFTSKEIIRKAIGSYCFLIVGVGKVNKKYYLWSLSVISKVEEDNEYDHFVASGPGYYFAKPILLNDLPNYPEFKNFCGNFGIGFQNITKHVFCRTLIEFAAINSFSGK